MNVPDWAFGSGLIAAAVVVLNADRWMRWVIDRLYERRDRRRVRR